MKGFDKHQKALEAVRKHYNCDGRQYRCKYYDDCVFGDGEKMPHECCECEADEFFSGYMCALLDKENEL